MAIYFRFTSICVWNKSFKTNIFRLANDRAHCVPIFRFLVEWERKFHRTWIPFMYFSRCIQLNICWYGANVKRHFRYLFCIFFLSFSSSLSFSSPSLSSSFSLYFTFTFSLSPHLSCPRSKKKTWLQMWRERSGRNWTEK